MEPYAFSRLLGLFLVKKQQLQVACVCFSQPIASLIYREKYTNIARMHGTYTYIYVCI